MIIIIIKTYFTIIHHCLTCFCPRPRCCPRGRCRICRRCRQRHCQRRCLSVTIHNIRTVAPDYGEC